MTKQSEMFFGRLITQPKRAPQSVIDSFTCYRDAVIWCWKNRVNTGLGERVDQAIFANDVGMHSPHMSRCVNPNTKAPMKLDPDLVTQFEAYTGWKAVTQYQCKEHRITPMEWIIEDRAAA